MTTRYGFVKGRVVEDFGDGDLAPQSGFVMFAPIAIERFTDDAQINPPREKCVLDADGWLTDPRDNATRMVSLACGVWAVSFSVGTSHQIVGYKILVTADHTETAPLDLRTAAPYMPPAEAPVYTVPLPAGGHEGDLLAWESGTSVKLIPGQDVIDAAGRAEVAASQAESSAVSAQESASAAGSSETLASESVAAAVTAKDQAQSAATSAAQSASMAVTAKETALTANAQAVASAQSAATSESAATTAAVAATTAATSATADRVQAQTAAQSATLSAGDAAQSAQSAADSAALAQQSVPQLVLRTLVGANLVNGWTLVNPTFGPRFRRYGSVVECTLLGLGLTGANATADRICEIPLGFRPSSSDGNYGMLGVDQNGYPITKDFTFLASKSRRAVEMKATWITTDPYPSI